MFDATQYVSQNTESAPMDRSPIPEGNYTAKMTGFERRAAKSGNGEMLNVEFTVEVGSAARKCWHNFNFTHIKPGTVEIAYQQMARLCLATGYEEIDDPWNPVELIDKPVDLYITVNANGYNEIKAFKKKETSQMDAGQKLYGTNPAQATPPSDPPVDDAIPF